MLISIFSHIPKAKATAIADTPELKRIAENTKIQSNVKYHADFEKQKGKLTQVSDLNQDILISYGPLFHTSTKPNAPLAYLAICNYNNDNTNNNIHMIHYHFSRQS